MDLINSKLQELQYKKKTQNNWNISWNLGIFLSNLIKINDPKNVLEIGTSNGFSSLCILKELNKTSKLYTIEINKERFNEAKKNFEHTKIKNVIQINKNIFEYLNDYNNNNNKFDFIFIDAAQSFYLEITKKLIEKKIIGKKYTIIYDNVSSHKNMSEFLKYMKINFKCELINMDSGFLIAKNK